MAATQNKATFNLNALDREAVTPGYEREPFVAELGTADEPRPVTFADPAELDWKIVVTMDSHPRNFFRAAIEDPEDRDYVIGLTLKSWQLRGLMTAFRDHYGIDEEGNAAASRR